MSAPIILEPIPTERLPGWEARLFAVLAEAKHAHYALGENDCFRLACRVIAALTGVDRWPVFAGRYTTRRECLALMAQWGSSFTAAASAFFGAQPVAARLARRGDILEFRDDAGEAHLVVSNGEFAAGMLESGLVYVRLARCAHAWRVG